MEEKENIQESVGLRPVESKFSNSISKKFVPVVIVVVIITAGIYSGLVLSSLGKQKAAAVGNSTESEELTPEQEQTLQVVTRDEAEGTLEKNDKLDETAQGQWKLIRPGGESQTAYLTSSYLDLDEYVGKNVKVKGESLGSDKVGWLLDVATVEVIK